MTLREWYNFNCLNHNDEPHSYVFYPESSVYITVQSEKSFKITDEIFSISKVKIKNILSILGDYNILMARPEAMKCKEEETDEYRHSAILRFFLYPPENKGE